MTDLSKITQADLDKKIADLVQRAESHLDHVGNSSKSDCLVYELLNQLKATNHALVFMTGCHKEWSDLAIKHKGRITELEAENTCLASTTPITWQLVPKEPSFNMIEAALSIGRKWAKFQGLDEVEAEEFAKSSALDIIFGYRAMLAASPALADSLLPVFAVDREGGHCD